MPRGADPAWRREYESVVWSAEVARLQRILLVKAASLTGVTHEQLALELGVSQTGVTRMLAKVSRTAARQLPRETLLPAAQPAVSWLGDHFGFSATQLVERNWYPTPYVDREMTAAMFGSEAAEVAGEPLVDLHTVAPTYPTRPSATAASISDD
ncbi:hypothetical protein ATK17_3066 [Branchiibius hedensis]|uniref:Uncharacterized protein n=1 Tax=Branchiibius hedensis TaxID=672460 RepID=A0A2Y8ZVY1_9MICO|nr:hypothetical protein [Branchiibius hedensis]PWJ26885.1 hypothetical protein ATK17_3066 [Branchiibius hedensis]SSA35696.1 hypothetical protein SAMN04489750_3066 [Branchiibius hedensis]